MSLKKILNGLKSLRMRASDESRVVENNNVTGIPSSGRIVKPLRGGRKDITPRGLTGKQSLLLNELMNEPGVGSSQKKNI